MVASIAALTDAAQASAYYEADDYYAEAGKAPSAWAGRGAERMGLAGEVDRDQFRALLEGRLPDGRQLGAIRDGQLEHRPGFDVTLSAPKSVSIMAEVAGDRRLADAHDRAVSTALSYMERHAAMTRIREDGAVRTTPTGELVAATFRHDTSREHDPQLHTHCVLINMTPDQDGRWRSVESLPLFRMQRDIGAVYRQALALEVRELGYTVREGRDSTFEIEGVPAEVIQQFSGRSGQIEKALADRGKTRSSARAGEKATLTLATRRRKEAVEREKLVPAWRAEADSIGFGPDMRKRIVVQAQENASQGREVSAKRLAQADRAVAQASRSLSERDARFTAASLEAAAGAFCLGEASNDDVRAAIRRAEKDGELVPRAGSDERGLPLPGYASRLAVETETKMLARLIHRLGDFGLAEVV